MADRKIKDKVYYEKNREAIRQKRKIRYAKNRAAELERNKQWRRENRNCQPRELVVKCKLPLFGI